MPKVLRDIGLDEVSSPRCPRCPDVKEHLVYSKLLEKKMEALFIKLWVYFLTERLLRSNTPSTGELGGNFVGIKEKDTPQHLSLARGCGWAAGSPLAEPSPCGGGASQSLAPTCWRRSARLVGRCHPGVSGFL